MLKWAVNQPRPSYLANNNNGNNGNEGGAAAKATYNYSYHDFHASIPERRELRTKLRRKSVTSLLGKENQLTSTPLPHPHPHPQPPIATTVPRLRDVSNIVTSSPSASASPLATPMRLVRPAAYASTLPTFEAEYSPGGATVPPGPLLALRGLGIPDSYFEKPRYLQHPPPPTATTTTTTTTQQRQQEEQQQQQQMQEQATLSSSQMGDVTLERMIDAILESTRKAPPTTTSRHRHRHRQQRQRLHLRQRLAAASPTYRPAFDPASDLREYWQQPQPHPQPQSPPNNRHLYEEREVRSPLIDCRPMGQVTGGSAGGGGVVMKRQSQQQLQLQLQLRRQRGVRRKRMKIGTKISSSVKHSAKKLLAAAARSAHKLPPPPPAAGAPQLPPPPAPQATSTRRHVSPDSGHNSTSDCDCDGDDLGNDEALEASVKLDKILQLQTCHGTKRRLSFSLTEFS